MEVNKETRVNSKFFRIETRAINRQIKIGQIVDQGLTFFRATTSANLEGVSDAEISRGG